MAEYYDWDEYYNSEEACEEYEEPPKKKEIQATIR